MDPMNLPAERKEDENLRRRRQRSIALALVLGVLAVIFYVLTIAKMGPGIFNRPL
jgi:hypothetical protein